MSRKHRQGELVLTGLQRVAERARKYPQAKFNSLAHLMDEDALKRAYHRLRKNAAVGVDGIKKEEYGQDLDGNIRDLHERMKSGRYRHQSIRRVNIPKGGGKTRPIGISATEDKIVQGALREVMEAIYEQDFMDCSYGFRPGLNQHDALRSLDRMVYGERITWILEADVQSFFDSLDRPKLREMLQERIVDKSLLRIIGKCIRVGVLDGEEYTLPEEGTAQGSVISPLLGNVYLHYALDRWFEQEVKPELKGKARMIRYADDFAIGFTHKSDAEHVQEWLFAHLAENGLTLHPEKTRLVPFGSPKGTDKGKGPGTFDFLGFTLYWCRTKRGKWRLAMKTRKKSVRRFLKDLNRWCRSHRHDRLPEQHTALVRRLRGHYNYFGVNGNIRSLDALLVKAERVWLRWLRRRSQRGHRLTWERFRAYLRVFPLPTPRICVQIWA